MINRNFLIIYFIFLSGFVAHAQTQYTYYFDSDFNLVKKSDAVFQGAGANQNGLFELKIFDSKSKKLLILEHFTDSSLAVSNGLFVNFLPNGNKELEGNYLIGKQDGLWKKWDWEGKLLDSSLFNNGEKISENIYNYYPGGKLMSQAVYSPEDHKMQSTFYDEKGNVITPAFKEDPDKVFTKTEMEASFPGGPAAWQKYISRAIDSNIDDFNKRDYGTVLVRFIVDIDGTVSEVEAITMKGTKLARVATDAVTKGPKWIAAQQNGHPVKAYRLLPISLQEPDK